MKNFVRKAIYVWGDSRKMNILRDKKPIIKQ